MERREKMLFRELKEGTSCFKFVPDNIGEIIYCDSTNPKRKPDSKEQIRKKLFLSIAIPLVIAGIVWALLYTLPILPSIVSIALLIILCFRVKKILTFKGKDFFVGTEGFAMARFNKTRDNITYEENYRFDNFSELVTQETIEYGEYGAYLRTNYFFEFYSKEEDGRKSLWKIKSYYKQSELFDYYKNRFYRFYKTVENSWSNYKLIEIKESFGKTLSSVGFTLHDKYDIYTNYIVIDTNGMQIGSTRYDRNSIKNLRLERDRLIVEHVNHTSQLLGLIQEGDKDVVHLNRIGNTELFLKLLEYFAYTCK